MQSFRTELENPVVERDIIDLEKKIRLFREGKMDEERFRSLRLARGVYGQRQPGVQMVRIKLPYGKLTTRQLRRICAVSDEYSTGNLHMTTRQDIQIHYVSLDRTPQLWAELERDEVTLREACGNTVRNVTASPTAGVDPTEPFDVTPHADAFFRYFLRNPICQEMGRKFKVAFSSSDADTAFAYFHDLGFIPKVQAVNGTPTRGFKVMIGGGLGAQPQLAQVAYEFLPEDRVIPFAAAVLRVFDRYGERARRNKARFKFLLKDVGLEEVFRLVEEERIALAEQTVAIDLAREETVQLPATDSLPEQEPRDAAAYSHWKQTNVYAQKQAGYYGVWIYLPLGNLRTETARLLADVVDRYAADDVRVTVNQGLFLRYVREQDLPAVYNALAGLNLATPGFDSTADITACPGTDTCNLGISNSTDISLALERVVREEYPELLHNRDLLIKISGCMNACGQHTIAAIGFHGSTLKVGKMVAPALQVLLGGGVLGDGDAVFADKLLKIPSKRALDLLRTLLDDYLENQYEGEYYHAYYQRQGRDYFYQLLKQYTVLDDLPDDFFVDWGQEARFQPAIGVGECAGVVIDLVATLLYEAEEKLEWADEALAQAAYADGIYHAYTAMLGAAKALLMAENAKTNTQAKIVAAFNETHVQSGRIALEGSFAELVYQFKQQPPSPEFAAYYRAAAGEFLAAAKALREHETANPVAFENHA